MTSDSTPMKEARELLAEADKAIRSWDNEDWSNYGAELVSRLAKALSLQPPRQEWEGIETLDPYRDGRGPYLLWKDGHYYTAKWVDSEVMGPVWATPDGHVILRATHWCRLPPPPGEPADGEREAIVKWLRSDAFTTWTERTIAHVIADRIESCAHLTDVGDGK